MIDLSTGLTALREYQRALLASGNKTGSFHMENERKFRDHAGVVHAVGQYGSFGAPFTRCEAGETRFGIEQLEEAHVDDTITCLECTATAARQDRRRP